MKFYLLPLLAISFLSFSGCATLSPAAEKMRIVKDSKKVQACLQVAIVNASASGNDLVAYHNAKTKFLNAAGEAGDTLLLLKDGEGFFSSEWDGLVFKCDLAPSSAEAPAKNREPAEQ